MARGTTDPGPERPKNSAPSNMRQLQPLWPPTALCQMLDILKANHDARLHWRARRKQEAHRGRAVLRAAKKALDQAAITAVRLVGIVVTISNRGL